MALVRRSFPLASRTAGTQTRAIDKAFEPAEEIFANYPIVSS